MSKTSNLLIKQYNALCNEREKLKNEISILPIGSIQQKKIKNGIYHYQQYREGSSIKTIFVPEDQLDEIKTGITRRKEVERRLKGIDVEVYQLVKALGTEIHSISDFEDYKPVKNVDYKDYTLFMSHLGHEVKRLGKDAFVVEYSKVKESGVRARYLRGLLDFISKDTTTKAYASSNLVLDPLTYQMYFTYGRKDILDSRIKEAIPEFLRQGLLITNIQEAVGGTFN